MEKSKNALVRGRQLCTQLSIFEGSLADFFFLTLSTSKIEEVSQNCFVFDVVKFKKMLSSSKTERKSRRIVSFSTLSSSKLEEVLQNSCVFKLADRQIDR